MPSIKEYVDWINEHYIMTRSKYILQRQDGQGYTTMYKPKLNDSLIKAHLKQEMTVGIFAGQYLNKFICFDIDCKEGSKEMTNRLIDCLVLKYGLTTKQILVSYSGSKGYHVELFFDKAIQVKDLQLFYKLVLEDMDVDKTEIEFRNTYHQAVKLPLSLNWKTKNECYLVDTDTLEQVSNEHLFSIEKVDTELFVEQLDEIWMDKPLRVVKEEKIMLLDTDVAEEFEQVVANVNLDLTIDYQSRIVEMLNSNSLLYPSSRHNSTLLLGTFFKEQGYEQEDAESFVYELLRNTFITARHLLSNDTTLEYIETETNRLIDIVYKKDYKLGGKSQKPVRITKEDVLFVLKPKKIHHKQLLFTMLCHSKKHSGKDGSFYMTYKQMTEMGNTTDRGRLAKYIGELKDDECIEILRQNERKEKSHLSKPNIYRMTYQTAIDEKAEYVELDVIKAEDFSRVTQQLLTQAEIKQHFSRHHIKQLFQESV